MTLYEDRTRGRGSLKMDPNGSGIPSPNQSPRLQYLQPISTPIRISPPSSPENKKLTKPHIHQPSPLSSSSSSSSVTTTATKEKKADHLVLAN